MALLFACAQGSQSVVDEPAALPSPSAAETVKPPPPSKAPTSDASIEQDATTTTPKTPPDAATPSTFVSGSASGVMITPAHASAIVVTKGGRVDRIVITIGTVTGFCADYANGVDRANAKTLILAVLSSGGLDVGAATYSVGSSKPATVGGSFDTSARILSYNAMCQTMVAPAKEQAITGTVTFTQVAGSTVAGTFAVGFPGGEQLTGALEATVCAAPGADSFTCLP